MSLTITDVVVDGVTTTIRISEGVIDAVGPDVVADAEDEVIDATGLAAVPGLVNGHGHAAMTLLRGYGSDLRLHEWLSEKIWPAEAKLTEDDVYWGTRLAIIEMLRSGTTHFFDMYWHPRAVARAAEEMGIRATVGAPLFDGMDPEASTGMRELAVESLDELAECGPLITPSLTPHAIYTVSGASLEWVATLAAERDLVVHIHLSETRREVEEWMADHDERPAFHLDSRGCLGPKTILAHGCHLDRSELELVSERGATVVTNPVSNLKLAGSAIFPYPLARECGVAVGLGTDGASSNNSLDLLADLKVFALVQKHGAEDPTVAPAEEALAVAQGRHSPLLGGHAIEVGAPGDLVLIDMRRPEMNPGPLADNLVYAATGAVVHTSVIAGRVVLRDGVVAGEAETIDEATRRAARLTAS